MGNALAVGQVQHVQARAAVHVNSWVLANHACVVIWGDILTLRYGRASWRNQLSRVDGFGIVFPKRDAAYRAVAQRRGVVLLNVGLQSRKVRRLG